jgi:hypothetical protein
MLPVDPMQLLVKAESSAVCGRPCRSSARDKGECPPLMLWTAPPNFAIFFYKRSRDVEWGVDMTANTRKHDPVQPIGLKTYQKPVIVKGQVLSSITGQLAPVSHVPSDG